MEAAMKSHVLITTGMAALLLATTTVAELNPTKESLSGIYHGKAYSPYAQRSFASFPL
jgi:hypothetical protein